MLEGQIQELRGLPARVAGVEWQILQLREEMQAAFSTTRSELRGEIHSIRDELRAEIRAGDQATRDFMWMLFEHYQTNMRTIGDGRKGRKR